jgi:predicted DNA-binding transcriptional regulator AlpA
VRAVDKYDGLQLMSRTDVRNFFGGISESTFRRGMRKGKYPKPIQVADRVFRWKRHQCVEAMERIDTPEQEAA